MKRMLVRLAMLSACIFAASAWAGGDAGEGKRQVAQCTQCHSFEAGGPNKLGPNLHGLFGSKAGAKANFAYSDAMKKSGITWDEATLDAYLKQPRTVVPGTKMMFVGVAKDDARANIIAYLKEATK